jgi:hypothetical protein
MAAPQSAPSTEVADLRAYYARVEADLIARGLLRLDPAPADAPFAARSLARDFEGIAFFTEYTETATGFRAEPAATPLRRWAGPVRIGVVFGPGVAGARAATDRDRIAALAERLSSLSGLPVDLAPSVAQAKLRVLVADSDARTDPSWLAQAAPDLPEVVAGAILNSPRDIFCSAYTMTAGDAGAVIDRAVVLIKDETPPRLRRACLEEELAQAMGLPNDSRAARPSIFNDAKEFALLTRHDEMLLAMLYDPALEPGMTLDEARPLLRDLAEAALAELTKTDGDR